VRLDSRALNPKKSPLVRAIYPPAASTTAASYLPGRPILIDLLKRRRDASYVAFGLLWLNGRDLRGLPLMERKHTLIELLLPRRSRLVEHALWVSGRGRDLFALVQRHDIEGIVAKRKADAYEPGATWVKIKNPRYSQVEGRGELFNPTKTAQGQPAGISKSFQKLIEPSVFVVSNPPLNASSTIPP
jgi:hypothetical protein